MRISLYSSTHWKQSQKVVKFAEKGMCEYDFKNQTEFGGL